MSFRNVIQLAIAGILWSCVLALQRPPPRYSQQLMPETSFTCRNKIVGSYYADPETDCQLFHVCVSVAGVIQDYKFLCPNDTAFDQESQTCADWYDVDCEAATLYYASDNFDLYRIGSGLESVHYDALRSDSEPQDHLQRSESNDPVRSAANNVNRVNPTNTYNTQSNNRDILRGSSSSNFYNSRNNFKDEDYDNDKTYQEETILEPKKKPGVRKIARKQEHNHFNHISSTSPPPSSTTNYNSYNNNNNNNKYNGNYYNNHRSSHETTTTATAPAAAAAAAAARPIQDYNRSQNNQKFNGAPSTFRPPTTPQQTYSTYQASSTTLRTTAYDNNYNRNQQTNNYNQQSNIPQTQSTTIKPSAFSQNYQHQTTPRSGNYNQNYQDNYNNQYNQNSRPQPTTISPSTNYAQTDFTGFQQRNYNNIQRSTTVFPTSTQSSTFYDAYSANNNQYNGKTNGVTQSKQNIAQTTKFYPNYSNGNTYVPTTYAPVTKKPVSTDGSGRGGDRYNSDNGQYNDKSSQKSTQFFDVTKSPKKPNQYSNYENSNTGKYFESSTTNYDFGRSPAGIGFSPSSINLLAETTKSTTPVPRRNGSPTTYNPNNFNGNNQRGTQQQQTTTTRPTTYVSGPARPFSTTVKFTDATTQRAKSSKKNDYDYAYYDNAGTLEYDGLDLEHVAGGKESAKIARN